MSAPLTADTETLRRVLLDHHPMQRTKEGPLTGCRCGQVRLGQDVIAHVAAQVIAALPPSPAEEAVKRRLELARIEGRAESLNAEVHEMEDDDDAQLLAVRAIQWEKEAAVLRAALASPAPAPQGGEQR